MSKVKKLDYEEARSFMEAHSKRCPSCDSTRIITTNNEWPLQHRCLDCLHSFEESQPTPAIEVSGGFEEWWASDEKIGLRKELFAMEEVVEAGKKEIFSLRNEVEYWRDTARTE